MRQLWLIGACLCVGLVAAHAQAPRYDLILRNARVVDGTGTPWFRADVAITGDTIARIAPGVSGTATRDIDVRGQVVTPGFIDIHTHARRGLNTNPTAPNYVRQGVTTVIEGPMDRRRYRCGPSSTRSKHSRSR